MLRYSRWLIATGSLFLIALPLYGIVDASLELSVFGVFLKRNVELLTMAAAWLSGFATLAAVAISLYLSKESLRINNRIDAVRCVHHSMVIVNDLRARVAYLLRSLREGNRPIEMFTINLDTILRRYETLFDRDLFRHLPGTIASRITNLSGSFLGLETTVRCIVAHAQKLGLTVHSPPAQTNSDLDNASKKLLDELEALFTDLEKLAEKNRD